MKKHDESQLPRWVQQRIAELQSEAKELRAQIEKMEVAHAVLMDRTWFTIPGPNPAAIPEGKDTYHLWFLDQDQPLAACSLHVGDVLLVGRRKS